MTFTEENKQVTSDPLAAEAAALAVAFGVRWKECDVRGITVKVREFTPDDLHPLYSWLIEIRHLMVNVGSEGIDARALIEHAVTSGTGILSLVTDGLIPADARLPMSVIGRLIDAIIEVNEDFFEVLPSLMRLFGGLPGIIGGATPAQTVPDENATESEPASEQPQQQRQPRDFPEPQPAQPDAGHSSSADSGAAATP